MTILVYLRRNKRFDDTVLQYAKLRHPDNELLLLSEYPGRQVVIDVNSARYDSCPVVLEFIVEHLDLGDIIFRDRVLRNLPLNESMVLIKRVVGNLLEKTKDANLTAVVGYPIDNYVTDIVASFAHRYLGIEYYGVCNFFVDGYKRITTYGEHKTMRSPSDEEASAVLMQLRGKFLSSMVPSRRTAFFNALVRYVKYKLRYLVFYIFGAKIAGRKEYDLLATPYNATVRSIGNFFLAGVFTPIDQISFKSSSVLVPLHYFPEATLEYWSEDLFSVEFPQVLLPKLKDLASRYEQVIVKEHPAMVFNNNRNFYREIKRIPGVVLIDPFTLTRDLLSNVQAVCCWTGSSGIEALVSGKSVEFCSSNYYCSANEELFLKSEGQYVLPEIHAQDFVKTILSGTIIWNE